MLRMATTAAQAGHQKLYHYQNFCRSHLQDALEGKLHFSNPHNFNDPWDCKPWFDALRLGDPTYRAKCIEFSERFHDLNGTEADRGALKARLRTDSGLLEMIRITTERTRKVIADHWRIYCLTPCCDSILMWSHYSDKHKGICLEFDGGNPTVGGAYQVMYNHELPMLDPNIVAGNNNEVIQILLNKSSVWEYEDEYRVVGLDGEVNGATPQFLPITDKCFLSLPPGVLAAVIVGCEADFDAIKTVVDQHAPDLPVKRMVRGEGQYSLSIKN
jgi:hypothetical protein